MRGITSALCAVLIFTLAGVASAEDPRADAQVLSRKLTVKDLTVIGRGYRLSFVAKDGNIVKGQDGDPALLSGTISVFYEDGSTSGSLSMPSPWISNKNGKAKYKKRGAPAGQADFS